MPHDTTHPTLFHRWIMGFNIFLVMNHYHTTTNKIDWWNSTTPRWTTKKPFDQLMNMQKTLKPSLAIIFYLIMNHHLPSSGQPSLLHNCSTQRNRLLCLVHITREVRQLPRQQDVPKRHQQFEGVVEMRNHIRPKYIGGGRTSRY